MEDITVVDDGEYLVFTNNFEHDCKIDVYYGYESSNSKQGKRFLFSITEEQMIIKNPDLNHRLFFLVCPKKVRIMLSPQDWSILMEHIISEIVGDMKQ